MFDNLVVVAISLITFTLIIGVGLVVVDNFSASQCNSGGYSYYNTTDNVCQNGTGGTNYGTPASNTSTPDTLSTLQTMKGYIGTGSGGLASWTTAIIALVIGVLFIGAIMQLRGKRY
jgi:hypothetical protein